MGKQRELCGGLWRSFDRPASWAARFLALALVLVVGGGVAASQQPSGEPRPRSLIMTLWFTVPCDRWRAPRPSVRARAPPHAHRAHPGPMDAPRPALGALPQTCPRGRRPCLRPRTPLPSSSTPPSRQAASAAARAAPAAAARRPVHAGARALNPLRSMPPPRCRSRRTPT